MADPIRGLIAGEPDDAGRAALDGGEREAAFRRDADRLRPLLRAVEQGEAHILVTDAEGRVEYANPRFAQSTGYSQDEILGSTPERLLCGITPSPEYQVMWETVRSGGIWKGEYEGRRKDGSLLRERASVCGVRDAQGRITHYVHVADDVTEQRRAEERLRAAERQLMLVQKMEAIGRLAGGIAHDFNNLLSVILGQSERLSSWAADRPEARSRLLQIVWTAEKAAALTRQLLAFSRQQVLDPRVVRLDEIVDDARGMLKRVMGDDVELAVVPRPELGSVKVDPGQLVQVLLNLAVNARDAMPDGGRLTVEFEDVLLDETYVMHHPPCVPGHYVLMAVTDTGRGMDRETQRHVFEPFFTTKAEGIGTGLGLSTVYGIVKQSGGFIWVYSEIDVGTVFKIYLPAVAGAAESVRPVPPPLPPARPAETARILLVEDDSGVRELMADILASLGHSVVEASRPADALAVAAEREPFDLLITDMIMPGMSGRELARRLRESGRVARVVFVSGYTAEALAHQGGIQRGERFLQKPFSHHALASMVEESLKGGGNAAPAVTA